MDANAYGGTPPQLWKTQMWKKFTAGTTSLIWNGLVRDQVRIARLCRQVEHLSWMLEWMDENMHISEPANLESAEEAWRGRT